MQKENTTDNELRIITIASGKGGVGKTNIALNLALSLSKKQRRVCLLDADFGLANVDILLGISPEHTLMDYIENNCSFDEVISNGTGSLRILPGGTALDRLLELTQEEKGRLRKIFQYLRKFDDLVIDVSAGISENVLHFLESASIPVLVVIPEPTSLVDAYALLKTHHLRGHIGPVWVIVNRAKSEIYAKKVYKKFQEAVNKHIKASLKLLGYVLEDENIGEAVSRQTPLIDLFPDSAASLSIKKITAAICSKDDRILNSNDLKLNIFNIDPSEVDEESSEKSDENNNISNDSINYGDSIVEQGETLEASIRERAVSVGKLTHTPHESAAINKSQFNKIHELITQIEEDFISGYDKFHKIRNLLKQLEADSKKYSNRGELDALKAQVESLSSLLLNHTHGDRTEKGSGHNNNEAITGSATQNP